MGLATVTGICSKTYGCVIGEMGVSGSGSGGLDDMVMWSIERFLVTGDPHLVVSGPIALECISPIPSYSDSRNLKNII